MCYEGKTDEKRVMISVNKMIEYIDTRVTQVRKNVFKPHRHWHAFKHHR